MTVSVCQNKALTWLILNIIYKLLFGDKITLILKRAEKYLVIKKKVRYFIHTKHDPVFYFKTTFLLFCINIEQVFTGATIILKLFKF